ncbi:MAG: hypothetical protein IJV89_01695 [Lentisphaeria bacterium]|nr:hypothetical protein [Lentisphaeria bacterium]
MKITAILFLLVSGCVSFAGHLGYIFPAGGRAGETVEVLIGGQGNWGCNDIYTGTDKIRSVHYDRIVNVPFLYTSQREYYRKYLREKHFNRPIPPKPEKQDDWRKNKMLDEIDNLSPVQMNLLLRALYTRPNPLQISPSIGQKTIIKIAIAPDTKPGVYYLRLMGRGVITNPVPFMVGTAPEIQEQGYRPPYIKKEIPEFTLPASVNGQIRPGETDEYKVRLKAGTRCYFKLYGRFFKPYVGDGVPGFFQPILELRDEKGKQVAIAERTGVEIDPLLTCTAPADGVYTLLVRDSLYRGREDFVYRIDCGTGTAPQDTVACALPELPRKVYLPGMSVTEPVLITGVLASGQKVDIRFSGKKGEVKVFETFARRIGSTLDTVLRLYAPDGKLLAENDDTTPEVLAGNAMHFADSHLMVTLPVEGDYRLEMADRADEAGKFFLRIDRPRPDFQLLVTPSGLESIRGNSVSATLFIIKKEGFNAPIQLALSGSKLAKLTGNTLVPPGVTQMPLSIYEPGNRKGFAPEILRLSGTAKTSDGNLVRYATAADPAMQAFAYTHYITAPEFLHTSLWRVPGSVYPGALPKEVKIPCGKTKVLTFRAYSLPANAEFSAPKMPDAPAWLKADTPEIVSKDTKKRITTLKITIHIAADAPADADIVQALQLPFQYVTVSKDKQSRTRKSALPLPAMRIKTERINK